MQMSLQLLAMNAGQKMLKGLTPNVSALLLLAFVIFAMGFAMTLVGTLKVQWGHQTGEAKYIRSGVVMLALALIIIACAG